LIAVESRYHHEVPFPCISPSFGDCSAGFGLALGEPQPLVGGQGSFAFGPTSRKSLLYHPLFGSYCLQIVLNIYCNDRRCYHSMVQVLQKGGRPAEGVLCGDYTLTWKAGPDCALQETIDAVTYQLTFPSDPTLTIPENLMVECDFDDGIS
jgi:hypothetical protein